MNNIYELLNKSKIDLEVYEKNDISAFEKKQMIKSFKKKNTYKYMFKKKLSIIASSIIFVCITFMLLGKATIADIEIFGTTLEEFLSIDNNIDNYKTIIGKEVSNNGITIKLNEVLLDENQIIVSSSAYSNKVNWSKNSIIDFDVYINGKNILTGGMAGSAGSKIITKNTCNFIHDYTVNNNIIAKAKGNLDIKIIFRKIYTDKGDFKGRWVFNFKANKDNLSNNIKTINIDKTIIFDNQKISIKNVKISPFSFKLNYILYDYSHYDISFIVKDQDGKEIKSSGGGVFNEKGQISYIISKDTIKLRVTPIIKKINMPENGGEITTETNEVLEEQAFEMKIDSL